MSTDPEPGAPVVAVASGKGGVGKTTVAVNLALALRNRGERVGLVDADIYGPDVPRMLGLVRTEPAAHITLQTAKGRAGRRLAPIERHGLQLASTAILTGHDQPVATDAGLAQVLTRRLLTATAWDGVTVIVVDLPPGTGDVQQHVLLGARPAAVVLVVTPDEIAHLDTRRLLALLRQRDVTVLGAVENMAGLDCPHCGETIALHPPVAPERSIWSLDVARLASVPFRPATRPEPPLLTLEDAEVVAAYDAVATACAALLR